MKNQTVINRYARALLNLGLEDGRYADYGRELKELAGALAALGEEAAPLTSPIYPAQVRRKMLEGLLAQAGLSPMTANFLRLLLDKAHLTELPDIAEAYNRLADAEKGLLRGELTSAAPLGAEEIAAIQATLGRFSGRQVELAVECDPALIGGVVARLGDLLIDGSLRAHIGKLAESLDSLS